MAELLQSQKSTRQQESQQSASRSMDE